MTEVWTWDGKIGGLNGREQGEPWNDEDDDDTVRVAASTWCENSVDDGREIVEAEPETKEEKWTDEREFEEVVKELEEIESKDEEANENEEDEIGKTWTEVVDGAEEKAE